MVAGDRSGGWSSRRDRSAVVRAIEHPEGRPEHHGAWVDALPDGALDALTHGQLTSWPPAALWRRLIMLCDHMGQTPAALAYVIADRLYPHADSNDLPARARRKLAKVRLAPEVKVYPDAVARAMDALAPWLCQLGGRQGRAARLVLVVPELTRLDGVTAAAVDRGEGRVEQAEPLGEPEKLTGPTVDPKTGELLGEPEMQPLGEPENRAEREQQRQDRRVTSEQRTTGRARGPRQESEAERERRLAAWRVDYWRDRGF